MLEVIDALTFAWLLFWVLHVGIYIAKGNYQSIYFLIIALFFLNGLPLMLDVLIGQPDYLRFPGFRLATRDTTASILYCIYIGAIPPFWWVLGRAKSAQWKFDEDSFAFLRRYRPLWHILLVAPIIAVLLAPSPQLYLNYAWFITSHSISVEALNYQTIITLFSTLSLLSAMALLIATEQIHFLTFVFLVPWVAIAIWLNGKRNLAAMAVALVWFVLWRKGYLKKFDSVVAGVFLGVLLLTYSYSYQETIRGFSSQISDQSRDFYENFRIDYGRDDRVKMTIFAELHPEQLQILEYRGQSLLFDFTMYVPRSLWPEKPFPYATYFTSAMFRISPRSLGWGMTTSWLEEAIANFSWLGFILGPLIPALICRIGDARKSIVVNGLTVLVGSLFLSVQLSAFAPIFILWLLAIILTKPVKMDEPSLFRRRYSSIR